MNSLDEMDDIDEGDGADSSDTNSSKRESFTDGSSLFSSSKETESSTPVLAQKETTAVNRSKLLVYLVLALAATGVGYATYYFLSEGEQDDFEVQVCYCVVVWRLALFVFLKEKPPFSINQSINH
jgi:hypothetical protein